MAVITSSPSGSSSATVSFTDWVLSDPTGGSFVVLKDVTGIRLSETENLQWFEPIGSNRAIAVSDEIIGAKFDIGLEFYNESDFMAFRTMRQLQRTLFLRDPWGHGWYVRFNESLSWEQMPGGPAVYRKVGIGATEVVSP